MGPGGGGALTLAAPARWARDLCRRHVGLDPVALAGAVAGRVAAELGDPSGSCLDGPAAPVRLGAGVPEPPGGWADPWLVSVVHEVAVPGADRRARGAWYTPRPVVEGLLGLALAGRPERAGGPALVVDPMCGGGAFLLAALDRFVAAGVEPAEALGRVAGRDLDPGAVQVSRWGLALWWLARAGGPAGPAPVLDLGSGDALEPWPRRWREGPVLVAGNPPFATPLKQGALPESATRYRAGRGEVLGPYADLAALHLLQAVEQVAPGSTVALVQPQSVLAGRDTAGLRERLAGAAPLRALWAAREAVFDAGVRACAVVLDVGGRAGPAVGAAGTGTGGARACGAAGGPGVGDGEVVIASGPAVTVEGRRPRGSWGELAADALGAPPLPPPLGAMPGSGSGSRSGSASGPGRLGELVAATAGFRDEHYALVAACREAAAGEEADGRATARLVTVGAVDPLWSAWGTSPIRFGGRDWERPLVDHSLLSPRIGAWLARQLRPKVVLATQSRLLEPCLDRAGVVAPATPLIAVHAEPDQLHRVAAVLLAPPVAVWAWRRWFGTAMAIDSVKLAARQVVELPLPADLDRWEEAAALLAPPQAGLVGCERGPSDSAYPDRDGGRAAARAVAVEVARLMTEAYGAEPAVFEWWVRRLPGEGSRSAAGRGRGGQAAPALGGVGGPVEMVEARPERVR